MGSDPIPRWLWQAFAVAVTLLLADTIWQHSVYLGVLLLAWLIWLAPTEVRRERGGSLRPWWKSPGGGSHPAPG